jgi:hypothetical protein
LFDKKEPNIQLQIDLRHKLKDIKKQQKIQANLVSDILNKQNRRSNIICKNHKQDFQKKDKNVLDLIVHKQNYQIILFDEKSEVKDFHIANEVSLESPINNEVMDSPINNNNNTVKNYKRMDDVGK